MNLYEKPLTPDLAASLADSIREADRKECILLGHTVEEALFAGYAPGVGHAICCMSHSIQRPRNPIGAMGWTHSGIIWALWADLTKSEAVEMLRRTPEYVRKFAYAYSMTGHNGCLKNYIHSKNSTALKWLGRSKCFDLDDYAYFNVGDELFYRFVVKPFAQLPKETP